MLSTILYLLWALITVRADQKLQPDEVNTVTPPEETFPWSQPRLPTSIKPEHYFLSVHPDVGSDSFTGQVRILITVVNDTSFIILNSKDLVIQEATLLGLSVPSLIYQEARPVQSQMLHRANVAQEKLVKQPMALRVLESEATEQLALLMDTPLVAGHKYQLSLSYSGKFSDSNSGIYKASYRTPADAAPRTIVATHFEPSAARKAFPCFDEPSMKAVFSLVVVRRSEHISLSNMPKLHTEAIEDGLEQDYYQTSVRMSSYLVAFVICDYAVNSAETKRGVKVSVFAANHLINQTHYALQSAVEIMDIYEQLFQIAYPLPKLDLVAVPDVEAVGTESWGLVTFREASLLYQEQRESRRSRLRVSLLTAHELAHQWFGNLVTMHCWRDVWLKEGFASYLEHIAVRHLKPDWCVDNQHLLLNTFAALDRDSMLTSHPVSQPVSLPVRDSTQIRHTFDVVSHNKGAAVIGMLHSYLSDSVFMGGIRHYLSEHRYDSAKPDDLWRAMTETAQRSNMTIGVKSLMDTWITQTGYPVVTVTVRETHIHLQQNLFTILPQNDTGTVWQIPFTFYTSSSSAVISHLMKSKEEVIELPEDAVWIKANVNSTGFYRVSYDSRTLGRLHSQLQGSQPALGPADRAGLVDDAFHLARQGSLKYCDAFTLSTFLMKEEEYLPITVFINHMMNMIIKFSFRGEHCITRLLKEHLWAILGRQAGAQRWEDAGSLSVQIRRVKLLEVAVRTDRSPASEQEALRLFHFWMAKDGDYLLPSSLRGLIFQVAVMSGGHEEWTYLLQKYCHCSSSKEKVLMLTALCHTKDREKIQWLLNASLEDQVLKAQDFALIVEKLAGQARSNEIVWKFLQNNWDKLVAKFPLDSSCLSGIVTAATSHFSCTKKYDEVYDFFVTQRRLGHLSFVRSSLELIQVNMHWLNNNTASIQAWLQKTYKNAFKAFPLCKKKYTYHFKWGATIHISV